MSWFQEIDTLAGERYKARKHLTVDDVLASLKKHEVREVRQSEVYQLHMMVQDADLLPALERANVRVVSLDDNFV